MIGEFAGVNNFMLNFLLTWGVDFLDMRGAQKGRSWLKLLGWRTWEGSLNRKGGGVCLREVEVE